MRRPAVFSLVLWVTACAPTLFRRPPRDAAVESLYWNAIAFLDPANQAASVDSALLHLDSYLAAGLKQTHRREALVLQQLARDAKQLTRVQVALQHSRPDTTAAAARPRTEPDAKRRDEETVREIQRLKDELAKANEELERIRKRLAAPKPPGTD